MNETEIAQMEEEILSREIDPMMEMEWNVEQDRALLKDEAALVGAWRLWKHMRNDAKLKETAAALKDCRDKLQHLKARRVELKAILTPKQPAL